MGTNVDMDGRATEVGSADWVGTFADGSMSGKIALIQRGACYFTSKVINAQNAGAVAVVIYNHSPGTVTMGGPEVGITIPAIFIDIDHGTMLNEAVTADASTSASIHCGSSPTNLPDPCSATGLSLTNEGDVYKTDYGNNEVCTWTLTCSDEA